MTRAQRTSLGEQLREAIVKTGLSLSEISRRSGVGQPILSRFIRGKRSLTLPIAGKLCGMLGLRLTSAQADAAQPKATKPPPKKTSKKK